MIRFDSAFNKGMKQLARMKPGPARDALRDKLVKDAIRLTRVVPVEVVK